MSFVKPHEGGRESHAHEHAQHPPCPLSYITSISKPSIFFNFQNTHQTHILTVMPQPLNTHFPHLAWPPEIPPKPPLKSQRHLPACAHGRPAWMPFISKSSDPWLLLLLLLSTALRRRVMELLQGSYGAVFETKKSLFFANVGLDQLLRGGVITDAVSTEQARLAEEAGRSVPSRF